MPDPRPAGNAIALASTPRYDTLREKYPFSMVDSCGEAVGLVAGNMGGSEIGHFAIGAGRIVPQFLLQINWAIQDKSFFENEALTRAFSNCTNSESAALHLLGMISDAGVHSDITHLMTLLEWVKKDQLKKVYIHCIGDGRDVAPQTLMTFLTQVGEKIMALGLEDVVKFGTICGRFYAMDRDNNWDRTKEAYQLYTELKGETITPTEEGINGVLKGMEKKIKEFYNSGKQETSDYYLQPILCTSDKDAAMKNGDSVIFFNYRTDRPRQLTQAFESEKFNHFHRTHDPKQLVFITFGPYSERDSKENKTVCFATPAVKNNLGSWLAQKGVKQLRVAETEKYAHVTYFFNSQNSDPYELESRIMVPSKKCKTFAEIPEMSAAEITTKLVTQLKSKEYDFVAVNYANADLVGHTGQLAPTIKSVEALDECLHTLNEVCIENGYVMVLTADHGNAEDMIYDDGSPRPSHSMNKVIFMVTNYAPGGKPIQLKDGGLADVAPTCLDIMGVEQPKEMTGKSLLA